MDDATLAEQVATSGWQWWCHSSGQEQGEMKWGNNQPGSESCFFKVGPRHDLPGVVKVGGLRGIRLRNVI